MTSDGDNNAPALSHADVGIAVEGTTDAAGGAADIVLTEPGLSTVVPRFAHRILGYAQLLDRLITRPLSPVSLVSPARLLGARSLARPARLPTHALASSFACPLSPLR
ncbi:uncharacterized protein B0H18DRAFT_999701 [Fomitopsis serialis]|uniref:uncharacterized protein n=1 Tax=Fomitopsis serialis TaxID=139415 RepID=UPI00200766A5|nr:uncharacterized protein B0H18DRAFT_999701 [Neoantrodia serialis]KAH9928611.1 hypothetical protein B0H18DRAFT_999701 [Neoantrodia serialis]